MLGDVSPSYIVQLSNSLNCTTAGKLGLPLAIEPYLIFGGGLSIVVDQPSMRMFADTFRVVINYN